MVLTAFQVLDKAIEAGGTKLSAAKLGGASAAKVRDELCDSGLLEKSGGNKPTYSITDNGRTAWEREAPPDRQRQVREREQREQRKKLIELLETVEKKQGNALARGEQTRFAALVEAACKDKLIEKGTKANSYRILPAGKQRIRAALSLEQIDQLRGSHQQLVHQWRTTQQHFQQELAALNTDGLQSL